MEPINQNEINQEPADIYAFENYSFCLKLINKNVVYMSNLIHHKQCEHHKLYIIDEPPLEVAEYKEKINARSIKVNYSIINKSHEPLDIEFYSPILNGKDNDCTVYVPQMNGAVIPLTDETEYQSFSMGQLTSLFYIMHSNNGGQAVFSDKTPEYEENYRTGIIVNGKGIPQKSFEAEVVTEIGSGVKTNQKSVPFSNTALFCSFIECIRLRSREHINLAAYYLIKYDGSWLAGAESIRNLRKIRPYHQKPAFMKSIHAFSEVHGRGLSEPGKPNNMGHINNFNQLSNSGDFCSKLGAPIFHLVTWWNPEEELNQVTPWKNAWWAYSMTRLGADPALGGDQGLISSIQKLHLSGSKILLYVSPWTIALDSQFGHEYMNQNWQMLRKDGSSPIGYNMSAIRPCPMVEECRQSIVLHLLALQSLYNADGFFIDETAAISNESCYNTHHNHTQPHIWTYGVYLFLKELRIELDKIKPDALIFLEGGSEMMREYVDGFLTHSHGWTMMRMKNPVTRAVSKDIGLYESCDAYYDTDSLNTFRYFINNGVVPFDPEHMAAINFISGVPYYTSMKGLSRMQPVFSRHKAYRLAYPELFSGDISSIVPKLEPEYVRGFFFNVDSTTILAIGNMIGAYGQQIRVCVYMDRAQYLYDRVEAKLYEFINGRVQLNIEPWGIRAYEVIR